MAYIIAFALSLVLACPSFAATWTTGAPMTILEGVVFATALDGKLYVLGLADGSVGASDMWLNTVETYDPTTNTWTVGALAPPSSGVPIPSASINGKDYVIGEMEGLGAPNTLWIHDLATDGWAIGPPMPTVRIHFALAAVGGKLYAVGGMKDGFLQKTLDIYDPVTRRWTTGRPMPTARMALAAHAIGGKLYTIGGRNGEQALKCVEIYNPATDRWTTGPPMPTARMGFASGVIDGRLYVVGGWGSLNIFNELNTLEIFTP